MHPDHRQPHWIVPLAIIAALGAQGCLTSPANHQKVCGANATVPFNGFLPWPSHGVVFEASASSTGPWTTIGQATSDASGYLYPSGGLTHYPFSASLKVPSWTSSGSTLKAYVRARTNAGQNGNQLWQYLTTFDVTTPTGGNWFTCITKRVDAGDTLSAALNFCASPQSPVVEITAPSLSTCACTNTLYRGDLTIDSAAVAASFVCLQTLNGSLTVTQGAPEVLPLPSLQAITGSVTLDYSYPFQQFGNTLYRPRKIELPLLTAIGGAASVTAIRTDGVKTMTPTLSAVTSVGGNITISLRDVNPSLFAGLTSHVGNITLQGNPPGGGLDVNAGATFPSLTHVTGDITVQNFFGTNGLFNALQTVTGNVTLSNNLKLYGGPSFVALTSVSGNLHFVSMTSFGGTWTALQTVGGELGMLGQQTTAALNVIPVGAIAVGSLRLENNLGLVDLAGTSFHVGAGPITLSGNTALSQCAVDAFVNAQTAAGWTGTLVSSSPLVPCTP